MKQGVMGWTIPVGDPEDEISINIHYDGDITFWSKESGVLRRYVSFEKEQLQEVIECLTRIQNEIKPDEKTS